ncbi:hypothetical protein BDV25DRAFT_126727 [Aspergillus avenaceus]|uniref:Flavin reductase like domain-containing protein n=1 Tax=Aspergillus avenaceus TaxID=36643 RepID=A0A5N6U634_ASPAV|nr:hypothetical protein BDV25DRAFT_126727 [Aspergillus avenaceus]
MLIPTITRLTPFLNTIRINSPRKNPTRTRMSSSTSAQAAKIIQDTPDFEEKELQRPDFIHDKPITYGDGVLTTPSSTSKGHREIDPYAPDRAMINNYRLLVSAVAPRPIGFLSTVNKKGEKNLSPFSYFQVIDHDPPMFIVGFSSRPGRAKDTFANLQETGECVINSLSENMIEAVNATSIDAPYGVSEWEVSGLTEAESSTVRPGRVLEFVFSVEGKVVDEEGSHVELEKLRPVGQLGAVAYSRVMEVFERPRKRWSEEVGKSEVLKGLER